MPNERVLVVGFDGAPHLLVNQFLQAGIMPNLEAIAKSGAGGRLKSTLPPQSLPAWPSFSTGMNPGKHGVYSFFKVEPSTYLSHPPSSEDIRGLTLWDYLGSCGRRSILVNMPLTYPPYPINGIMVSGFPAPQIGAPEIACSPESMLNELQKVAPKYRIEAPYTRDYQTGTGDESNILRMLDETMKERTKLILHLIEQRWDVFFAIFTCSDRVQHIFWRHLDRNHPAATPEGLQKYGSVIANFFHELDHALGLIMGKVDASTTTFVVSDHGHAAQVAHVGVNQLLAELGIVRYHRAYQFGLTTDTLIRLAASFGISVSLVKKLVPKKVLNKIPSGIDFSRSTAYCYRFGAINLNVKGRESLGIVDKERFEAERDNLARTLLDYVDPQTGMRLVEKILKPEEIYSGEQTSSAPDLLVIFRDGYGPRSWNPNGKPIQRIDSSEFDVTKPIIECGGHHWLSTVDGIFFVNGPTVRNDQSIDNAEIIDVAPTILHLLSLPIPKNMDGKVLSIFRPDSDPAIRPVEHGPDLQLGITERSAWTKEEEAEITRRLANLGYMG